MPTPAEEIQLYLDTGEPDPSHLNWPGANCFAMANAADTALREALVAEVGRKAMGGGAEHPVVLAKDVGEPIVAAVSCRSVW